MTHSRSEQFYNGNTRQTDHSNGCLSGLFLPPLVVLCFGIMLGFLVSNLKINDAQGQALATSGVNSNAMIAPLFTPEIQYWATDIQRWSAAHGIDPNIAATVMQIESCGNPDAHSSAGASGLFQVMPFHFLADENAFDPETNALRGLNYLENSLKSSRGDARLALAGYNGGIGVIDRSESTWAAETIRYAYWGSGIYADAAQNASTSARLNEWLANGGASLCKRARDRLGLSQ